ncbi:multinuclear nonheme iron-dependent oxidase [Halobacillus sp. B23F22_1]|uniref:multinuclear nonheme iron-dependent oxidase n=1 Tax=Halobacillus sp. B23F22_1 TaxID=3459514 RepID=UPI00373F9559
MKFAINYSPEAQQLIDQSMINIDLFKCPDFDKSLVQQAEKSRPSYIHFDLNAGQGNLNSFDWLQVEEFLSLTSTPFINLHLVAYSKDFPSIESTSLKEKDIEQVKNLVIKDIQQVVDRFGAERVILENVVYRDKNSDMLKAIVTPEIISDIVHETKCGLLLDIAHAQMTCYYSGENVYNYISRFPVERLKELHITGIQKRNGSYKDSMPMVEADWQLAEWALLNIKQGAWSEPWIASFEYGGVGPIFEWRTDKEVMRQQVPKLYNLVVK